jgi:tellurite resistance protein
MSSVPTLSINHIQAIVRGMYEVAKTDGVHNTELVMMRGFYEDCQREVKALTSFDDLIKLPFDLNEAKAVLNTDDRKAALLQSCVMVAYADGRYSAGERTKIQSLAAGIGVTAEALLTIETAVADSLMEQISKIRNIDALQEVAAEIKPQGN